MNIDQLKLLGTVHIEDQFLIFFGKKIATIEKIQKYTQKPLSILKQVHGTRCVPSQVGVDHTEADAQWISNKNIVSIIKTADCLPIMVTNPQSNTCLAIHAGWRGVKDRISPLSIKKVGFKKPENLKVWIGPHLQKMSFEVDRDIADDILMGINRDDGLVSKVGDKLYINLSEIIVRQLMPLGILRRQIYTSDIDTKTDNNYYSYRQKDTGRNYSFCVPL